MRILKLTMLACLLGMLANAHAAESMSSGVVLDPSNKDEMCKHMICQHGVRVTLKKQDGSTFDKVYDLLAGVVQPGGLTIVAGQTLYIEADTDNNGPTNFRVVETVTHPEKTLSAKLQQADDGQMLLKVSNPFKRALKFDMSMMPLEQPILEQTSSCPIAAGGFSFESWRQPLFLVVLTHARFIDLNSGQVACD